jgi:hypothetical protein
VIDRELDQLLSILPAVAIDEAKGVGKTYRTDPHRLLTGDLRCWSTIRGRFDGRRHRRSGGRAMDFGWYGDADTSVGVSFLGAPDMVELWVVRDTRHTDALDTRPAE